MQGGRSWDCRAKRGNACPAYLELGTKVGRHSHGSTRLPSPLRALLCFSAPVLRDADVHVVVVVRGPAAAILHELPLAGRVAGQPDLLLVDHVGDMQLSRVSLDVAGDVPSR